MTSLNTVIGNEVKNPENIFKPLSSGFFTSLPITYLRLTTKTLRKLRNFRKVRRIILS